MIMNCRTARWSRVSLTRTWNWMELTMDDHNSSLPLGIKWMRQLERRGERFDFIATGRKLHWILVSPVQIVDGRNRDVPVYFFILPDIANKILESIRVRSCKSEWVMQFAYCQLWAVDWDRIIIWPRRPVASGEFRLRASDVYVVAAMRLITRMFRSETITMIKWSFIK